MKYCGRVGYLGQQDSGSGVWIENPTERRYYGDVIRNNRKRDTTPDTPNDSVTLNNSISIVADTYAFDHVVNIGYIEWCGAWWTVTNVEVNRPRLIITIGGVYNGPRADTEDSGDSAGE